MSTGLRVTLALVLALAFWLIAIGIGWAADPGCVTVQVEDQIEGSDYTILDIDPDLNVAQVGHYLWLQLTSEEASSTEHIVHVELYGREGTTFTACTEDTSFVTEMETVVIETTDDQPAVVKVAVINRWAPVAI